MDVVFGLGMRDMITESVFLYLDTGSTGESRKELQHHVGGVGEHSRASVDDVVEHVLRIEEVRSFGKCFAAQQPSMSVGIETGGHVVIIQCSVRQQSACSQAVGVVRRVLYDGSVYVVLLRRGLCAM